jgi:hypothetical protein
MAVSDDILASYRRPGRVVARHLGQPPREDRALALLLAALGLIFVAQWPGLSRAAFLAPEVPLSQRMVAAFLGLLAVVPVFYLLAAVSHVVARAFGGRGTHFAARIALFWALLAVSPLMLLHGLVGGFLGQGVPLAIVGVAVFGVFLWFWGAGLRAAEFGER